MPGPIDITVIKTQLAGHGGSCLWEAEVGRSPEVQGFKTILANMVKTHLY